MKSSSIFIAFAVSIGGFNAFSQVTSQTSVKGKEIKGLYLGLEYVNLTDLRSKGSFKSSIDGTTNYVDSKGGTHIGIAGLSAGYRMMNFNGIPITVAGGLKIMQTFNKSEYGDEKITFYVPEAVLGYLVTDNFELFGGLSIPVIRGSELVNKYESRGGISLGVSGNFTPNMSLKAAYNGYTFKLKQNEEFGSGELDVGIAGLAVSAQYMF